MYVCLSVFIIRGFVVVMKIASFDDFKRVIASYVPFGHLVVVLNDYGQVGWIRDLNLGAFP